MPRVSAEVRSAARLYSTRMRRDEVAAATYMERLWRVEVLPPYLRLAEHGRKDANVTDPEIDAIEAAVAAHSKGLATRWFQPQGRRALAAAKPWARAVGIPSAEHSFRVQHALDVRREASIQLVEKANRAYAADVRAVFTDPGTFGLRVEEIRDLLLERGNVSVSRARLIARDQTLKTYAGVTEAQHREAGIDSYVWSTSRDERVRPEHAALEGQTFAYVTPPAPGNPGEDYQCRCLGIPVLPKY